jgi:nucleotide-binding universal stress UspA family protein
MTQEEARLLVTFDGSEASKQIFPSAVRLAQKMRGSAVLLRVHHPPRDVWAHPDAEYREQELARVQAEWKQELESVAGELRAMGVTVLAESRMLGTRWNVSGEILAVADEYDADLICMATHGENPVRRFFAGSTALDVLANSKRPVVFLSVREE